MDDTRTGVGSRQVYRDPNLQIVFGVTLMAVLGVSSITPAFPTIVDELGITPQAVGSLITVFTLPGVLLTPVLGILADQFGRKRILVPALMLHSKPSRVAAHSFTFVSPSPAESSGSRSKTGLSSNPAAPIVHVWPLSWLVARPPEA